MEIHFGIRYYPPIVDNTLEMMGSTLSVNMSSYEKMCTLAELSNITVDPSESDTTCYEDSTLE